MNRRKLFNAFAAMVASIASVFGLSAKPKQIEGQPLKGIVPITMLPFAYWDVACNAISPPIDSKGHWINIRTAEDKVFSVITDQYGHVVRWREAQEIPARDITILST